MNTEPLAKTQHSRVFAGRYIDDGYDFIGVGETEGWHAVSAWGLDGWDLLDWPYYVVLFRSDTERAIYCEGDIDLETFASREAREEATNELALWYWTSQGESWVNERTAEDLRGPYSSKRVSA